ncbi:amyloid beta A4 precursor protein-binding family B member 1-interacting protein-like isoform X2 [Actinia tenebrosa]|uniref:Amyloid beta A4 precursor protein-binding family B member 1-interacting protein-like isoform X2 n=1 Tax=Actinia tenebrosa TaxID=6105 RepID=A0A6P8ID04_ACTTE|nr:amyloid beta A4 precursor protein-binding family B member 1-interacting protein-like isoform X2 [Actinia tenebrosa]
MESDPNELLSALRDAEEFISVGLSKESLNRETENKRQKLETRLKNLINRSTPRSDGQLPPRPPKSVQNATWEEEEEGEDLYDDVGPDIIEVKEESDDRVISQSHFSMEVRGVPKETQDNDTQESYEDMSNKEVPQEEMYDDTVNTPSEDDYEEPGKEDSTSITEDIDYEVAEPKHTPEEEKSDDVYEGVDAGDGQEETNKADAESLEQKDRTITRDLEMLMNPIKATDVKEVIYKGYLDKHRKKGKLYIGNKWQKRYCIVRSFAMYYFINPNSDRQKGTILLPGYKVKVNKQSKSNREFILTREKDRSYTFQSESKEEMVKWMDAIEKAAGGKISKRQSEYLDSLRSESPDGDEDSTSLCYDDVSLKSGTMNNGQSGGGEIYDDVNENDDSGSATIDYEIPQAEASEAAMEESTKEEAVQEDFYEMPKDENQERSAPVQPSRPAVVVQAASSVPGKPPSHDIPPTTEEEEELYDDVGVDVSPPDVAQTLTKPQMSLPTPPSDIGRASPGMPRPALPPPPGEPKPSIPPRRNGALPPEPDKETTAPIGKAPPPPPPEENTIPDKAPPPPPPEEETEDQAIDYSNIYQALWDCNPDADDELEFSRGDLIYIYEKPHSDWWIGSKYKPQGYETRLIPRNYLTEAYD